jgi:hypothetical protein
MSGEVATRPLVCYGILKTHYPEYLLRLGGSFCEPLHSDRPTVTSL